MTDVQNNIIRNIKAYRVVGGLTQEELAAKIDKSVYTISQIERGKSLPRIDTLADIANVFDCTVDELIFGGANTKNKLSSEQSRITALILAELSGQDTKLLSSSLQLIRTLKEARSK